MGVILFFAILLLLVIVHESGHFIVAKLCKMKVEEFAFGFPPRLFSKRIGETEYMVNILPLGGYVKIKGESITDENYFINKNDKRSFIGRPLWAQLLVVLAGVFMNWLLSFILFFFIAVNGHLVPANNNPDLRNINYYVTSVVKGSPIEKSGISEGDILYSIEINKEKIKMNSSEQIAETLRANVDKDIVINYLNRDKLRVDAEVAAVYGLNGDKNIKSFGIGFAQFGVEKLGFTDSVIYAKDNVIKYTKLTIVGMLDVFKQIFKGNISDSVTGPLGIYVLVSETKSFGADSMFFLISIISISLAVFNLLPIPALDGGRAMFIIYEMITKRQVNHVFYSYINGIGFTLLMILMAAVIYKDIIKLLI